MTNKVANYAGVVKLLTSGSNYEDKLVELELITTTTVTLDAPDVYKYFWPENSKFSDTLALQMGFTDLNLISQTQFKSEGDTFIIKYRLKSYAISQADPVLQL